MKKTKRDLSKCWRNQSGKRRAGGLRDTERRARKKREFCEYDHIYIILGTTGSSEEGKAVREMIRAHSFGLAITIWGLISYILY